MSTWSEFRSGRVDLVMDWFGNDYQYHDIIVPNEVSERPLTMEDLPTPLSQSEINSKLATYGAEAVRRARPGKEIGGAFQFLVELRDLPKRPLRQLLRAGDPTAIQQGLRYVDSMKKLGSEYLNVAFGWKPFVQDIQALHKASTTLANALGELARNHGRSSRRRRTIVNSETEDVSETITNGYSLFAGTKYGPGGLLVQAGRNSTRVSTKTTRRVWFAGRFSTYVPDMGQSGWTKKATRALYGGLITPDHLYQVVPWSWLINYGNNWGAVLSNLSDNASGHLMMDYGYLMQTLKVVESKSIDISWGGGSDFIYKSGYPGATQCSVESGWESKTRIIATPYGFGTKYDDLSGYQKSILAALGISRVKFR
jgi:hypothetical protein